MPIKAIVSIVCFAFCGLIAQLFGISALVFLVAHNYWAMLYTAVYSLLTSIVGSGFALVAWVSFDSWSDNHRAKGW